MLIFYFVAMTQNYQITYNLSRTVILFLKKFLGWQILIL